MQAFAHLQQGSDELSEMYLYCASEHLSKIHHLMDISQIMAKGLNHYTMEYGVNSNKFKDKVVRY